MQLPAQRLLFLAALAVGIGTAYAADDPLQYYGEKEPYQHAPSESWKEQGVKLPALPNRADLIPFGSDYQSLRYFIDPSSISVGTDAVVRYTVVVVASGGARNLLYEGVRCSTRQYKTYAYAAEGEPFHAENSGEWQKISANGADRFRKDLYAYFLCEHGGPFGSANDIIRRLKYPPEDLMGMP